MHDAVLPCKAQLVGEELGGASVDLEPFAQISSARAGISP